MKPDRRRGIARSDKHPVKAQTVDDTPALSATVRGLRPADFKGALHTGLALLLTGIALAASCSPYTGLWLAGQVILSFTLTLWFAVLHEAGHKTLFKSSRRNALVGQFAGVMAMIPFRSWRLVHARHHHWTGWHDLDPTTSATIARPLSLPSRLLINLSWWLWIPLFSVVYRLQNYWWLPKLWRQFPKPLHRRLMLHSFVLCILVYGLLFVWLGPAQTLRLFGLAVLLSFSFQDVLILSQHSHIPMQYSQGRDVSPFPPVAQEEFTRSLLFPPWFSQYLLLNIDAHELHHMYPAVPGYHLQEIPYRPVNAVPWWWWIWQAKMVRGDRLIFQNRNDTGWDL